MQKSLFLNSSGEIIQCGITNADGSFQMPLSKNVGEIKVRIFSRAFNGLLKVSVLNNPNNNSPYSIEKSVSVGSSDVSTGEILAYARASQSEKIEGGAFNILKALHRGK